MNVLKYCPDCGDALVSEYKCECGWKNPLIKKTKIKYLNPVSDKYGNDWPECGNPGCDKAGTMSRTTRGDEWLCNKCFWE